MASIDESSVTGKSEPVIRAPGSDQNSVTAGTRILSDEIKMEITSNLRESFLYEMINLIEGAKRKKHTMKLDLTYFCPALHSFFFDCHNV